jgi:hypothetical protein
MGYTTEFSGKIQLSRKLTDDEYNLLIEYNEDPDSIPGEKPGSYMQWSPTESKDAIEWDGNEKFYYYTEWLYWILNHLLTIGITANGQLYWSGEDAMDVGKITVIDSKVYSEKFNFI